MITIVCSSIEPKEEFRTHVVKMCGVGEKNIEFLHYENKGKYSLTELYDKAVKEAKNDIITFMHDDITIETKQWGKKVIKHFDKNEEFGILGVAGSKYMAETGRWWENRKKMYGRVAHTSQGKTWLSSYSDDLGNNVEETLVVDGVFFSIHRKRLKESFNLNVKGFHFYDVDFSFRNHIAGCKVGVHTNIRINHQSIGETNDEWEKNREVFAEEFKDTLPVRVDDKFNNHRLKVLMGCLSFKGLTGSEISTMETAKGLVKAGCDVTVVSELGEHFVRQAKKHGIKVASIHQPPGFVRGDGQWGFQTPEGFKPSVENQLYQKKEVQFDVIHANHTPVTDLLLKLYSNTPVVNFVRSEVIDLENPIVHDNIKKYVAIRPSIKDYMVTKFDIEEDDVKVIYNLFDKSRFKNREMPSGTDKPVTLFVGTMDYLRERPIRDLVEKCEEQGKELWLVGKDTDGYGTELSSSHDHVKYFPPTDKIEDFYYKCDETAGIFLGRTTIEGYLCGKPAIIYTVDDGGFILDEEYTEVPEDMSIFDNDTIINEIKKTYIEAYNEA